MTYLQRVRHHSYRLLVKGARYLHVYLTLFGFALLLFFAVTGFMLNHEDWFLPPYTSQGKVPTSVLENVDEDRTPLVEKLKDDFSVAGDLVSFELDPQTDAYRLCFHNKPPSGPTQVIHATVQKDGQTLVTREENRVTEHIVEGTTPKEMIDPWSEDKKLAIVEMLRAQYGVKGKVDKFDPPDELAIVVDFRAPGYAALAKISREDGTTKVTHQTSGVAGILLDLHRKKNSGEEWNLVIDGVAILFVVVSVTGLILWTSLRARAQHGLAVMGLGLAVGLAVYWFYVPR